MVTIINAPALLKHIIMPTISIETAIGMVTAGITLGVIVSQQVASFRDSEIVLQSSATIVLNRFIEPNELPFFYDVLQTMMSFSMILSKYCEPDSERNLLLFN